jgi:hypothetical protein
MSIELVIYLVNLIKNIDTVVTLTWIALILFIAAHSFIIMMDYGEFTMPKWKKVVSIIALLFMTISVVLPSEKTMTLMLAAHYGKEAVASTMGKKVEAIIDQKLDSMLKSSEK